jgi:hypothetical protein
VGSSYRPPECRGALKSGIKRSELAVFAAYARAPIYENVAAFNAKSLDFLKR